jgi:hypothetical protein
MAVVRRREVGLGNGEETEVDELDAQLGLE